MACTNGKQLDADLDVLAKPVTIFLPHRLYEYLERDAYNQSETMEHVVSGFVVDALRRRFSIDLRKPELVAEFFEFLTHA